MMTMDGVLTRLTLAGEEEVAGVDVADEVEEDLEGMMIVEVTFYP